MSSREMTKLGHCLVTGATGFLGGALVRDLLQRGHRVRGLDVRQSDVSHERFEFVTGDVCKIADLERACSGVDTVFHTAAVLIFAGLGKGKDYALSHSVNVGGVKNILAASRASGVKRLVYTSSNNVTFGDPVVDGDETWPYASDPADFYTETKILAEKAVLASNGKDGLLTCAIRPGGIYGPGDPLLLVRFLEALGGGLFVVTIGDGSAMSDNTFVENLSDGQIEAARHLVSDSPVPGQAYFITDGAPMNYFEFFRPFVKALGYKFPRWRLPAWPLTAVAWVGEILHWWVGTPMPQLSRLEVRKITVSHYSRIDKARRDFGWEPKISPAAAVELCIPYCREVLAARTGASSSAESN